MRVLLYIKKGEQPFNHISTATDEKTLDGLMQFAWYKVSDGYDVKIQHEQE